MAIAERELVQPQAEMPHPYRWTREQFYEMGDAGLFEGQRVILVEGEVLRMPPIGPQHQGLTIVIGHVRRRVFGNSFMVREQGPFDIGAATDPEPDLAVVEGEMHDFLGAYPTKAALIVEVSVSTLAYDRAEKAGLYAGVGIEDYWIVHPAGRQVEVYRRPQAISEKPFGFGYGEMTTLKKGDMLAPLARPEANIAVGDLLP